MLTIIMCCTSSRELRKGTAQSVASRLLVERAVPTLRRCAVSDILLPDQIVSQTQVNSVFCNPSWKTTKVLPCKPGFGHPPGQANLDWPQRDKLQSFLAQVVVSSLS